MLRQQNTQKALPVDRVTNGSAPAIYIFFSLYLADFERDNVTEMFLLTHTVQECSEGNIWDLKIHGGTNDLLPIIGA